MNDVKPVPPLAVGSVPVTPVVKGKPVALLSVTDAGVFKIAPVASVAKPVTFMLFTVPPTVDAVCQAEPFHTRSSLATVLKYWSPVVSALPSLSTVGLLALAPR